MDDLRAVLDDARIDRAALLCGVGATYMGVLFAATYPERTTALVVVNGYSRLVRTPDYPFGRSVEEVRAYVDLARRRWGQGATIEDLAPSMAADEEIRRAFARYERGWASPAVYASLTSTRGENDVRHVLPAIRVPTLVIHRTDARFAPREGGRYIAERIPGGRYVEVPGVDTYLWAGDIEAVAGEVEEFLTGARRHSETDRVLTTVLFTDIVGSTERAAALGDAGWKELLERYDKVVRSNCPPSAAGRSTPLEMATWRPSMARHGRSAARRPWERPFDRAGWRSGQDSIRARSSWSVAESEGSPSTSAPGSLRWPVRARSSCHRR
jgi:hypothetical protein